MFLFSPILKGIIGTKYCLHFLYLHKILNGMLPNTTSFKVGNKRVHAKRDKVGRGAA